MTSSIISSSPQQVKTLTVAGKTYRYGECANGYFLKEMSSGERMDFASLRSLRWVLDRLIEAAGDTDPEPTTPTAIPLHTASQRGYRQMAQRYGQATPSRNYSAAFADYLNRKSA